MARKPKCVMILSEGPSDRAALAGFFTDLYAMIDERIEVFFPVLSEDVFSKEGEIETNYNGDITSRRGINQDNILPMIKKLFIHPECNKHPAYKYPASICEVIHLVDIDGVYLDDSRIQTSSNHSLKRPFYDVENNAIIARDRDSLIKRNIRKRANIERMINTKRLEITMEANSHESRYQPYSVYFFSKDLDHVLYGKPNNLGCDKVSDAQRFANDYYNAPLEMARYFKELKWSSPTNDYRESWEWLKEDVTTLTPRTNINVLINDLLKRAKISL